MTLFQMIRKRSTDHVRRFVYIAAAVLSALIGFALLFVPFCIYQNLDATSENWTRNNLTPLGVISLLMNGVAWSDGIAYVGLVILVIWLAFMVAIGIMLIKMLFNFSSQEAKLQTNAKNILIANSILTGFYFLGGLVFNLINRAIGGQTSVANNYVPFILSLILDGIFAFYLGILRNPDQEHEKDIVLSTKRKQLSKQKGILFFFTLTLLVCALLSFFSDIITVTFTEELMADFNFSMNGAKIIQDYSTMEEGGQTLAFVLLLIITLVLTLFFLTLVSFLSKSTIFFRFALSSIVASCFGAFLIGMYGKYYDIVETMNMDMINALIEERYDGIISLSHSAFTVTSTSFYFFLLSVLMIGLLVLLRPYSKGIVLAKELDPVANKFVASIELAEVKLDHVNEEETKKENKSTLLAPTTAMGNGANMGNGEVLFEDPCPAFSEIDGHMENWILETDNKKQFHAFITPTLPDLVQFIVQYARNSRLHLFYTAEDIATFIAGLGMSKLTILQGMSGTGKTSLPKIFTEALFSNCEIVEVESSWRDKNELLGYYNEFSKTYTPKKFTQALYKARLNPDTLTFIVLDEMNLSRIEYYFSDFLSLMENEPDKREIKLLNVGLYQTNNGVKTTYHGLKDGHTIKIPPNVWFIGTANRDESTFEISDKVYDRAHTMNFNKRAKTVRTYSEPLAKQFLTASEFDKLLKEAKNTVDFNVENYPLIEEVEKLLAPYNISFGNRIALQIENFVSIYCACFTATEENIHDAVERILLSKVVSKLELKSIYDKEELATAFENLGLPRCAEFISKLNED